MTFHFAWVSCALLYPVICPHLIEAHLIGDCGNELEELLSVHFSECSLRANVKKNLKSFNFLIHCIYLMSPYKILNDFIQV